MKRFRENIFVHSRVPWSDSFLFPDGQTEAQAGTELARVTLPVEDPGLLYVLGGRSRKDMLGSWTGWGWQHLRARE